MPRCLAGILDREARAEERRAIDPVCDVVREGVQGLNVSTVQPAGQLDELVERQLQRQSRVSLTMW